MINNKYAVSYTRFLKSFLKMNRFVKVVLDPSNGSSIPILKGVFKGNKRTHFINDIPDGRFPGHSPNPLMRKASLGLQRTVVKKGADLGIIFDADGDRAIFIGSDGRVVSRGVIGRLLIEYLKPKRVVVDLTMSWLVKKDIPYCRVFRSVVGSYFIRHNILKYKADLGMESSGHFYFHIKKSRNKFVLSSAILASIIVINMMSYLGRDAFNERVKTLSGLYYRWEKNIKSGVNIKNLYKKYIRKKNIEVLLNDGLSVEGRDYWFNVRKSNTEDLVRVSLESQNKKTLLSIKKELLKLL